MGMLEYPPHEYVVNIQLVTAGYKLFNSTEQRTWVVDGDRTLGNLTRAQMWKLLRDVRAIANKEVLTSMDTARQGAETLVNSAPRYTFGRRKKGKVLNFG